MDIILKAILGEGESFLSGCAIEGFVIFDKSKSRIKLKSKNKQKKLQKNLEQLIGSQLNRDGFLIAGKNNKIELSGKNLKINGEKQPSNIWNKYKNLFERETGMTLTKDTKLVYEIEGKESKRKYKAF